MEQNRESDRTLCAARRVLAYYRDVFGADCFPEPLYFSENRSYLVRRQPGTVCAVLRMSRPSYHTEEELDAELRWMDRLRRDTSLILREPIAGADGKRIHTVRGEAGVAYHGTVFSYLDGTPLERLPMEEQAAWFERVGEITAQLHRHVRGWSGSRGLQRFRWDCESMLGRDAIWGDWRRTPTLSQGGRILLERANEAICGRLAAYGMTGENYGLIHSDLRGANLLTDGTALKIIDFDDCGYGWYMQDLSGSLSFVETNPLLPELIGRWLAGYRRIVPLGRQDIEMIPTFIMMRRLQLTAWVTTRSGSDAVRGMAGGFAAGTVELAERYLGGALLPGTWKA